VDIVDKVMKLAEGVCDSLGIDLVDVEIFRAGRRRVLRVYIGKAPAISVDDCANVSRGVSTLLDAENVMEDDTYTLEVSSPGIDRPFKSIKDWRRNLGRTVKVTTSTPIEGKFQFLGLLKSVDEAKAMLETPAGLRDLPMASIAQARCEVTITS